MINKKRHNRTCEGFMRNKKIALDIFKYDDYRKLLIDLIEERKAKGEVFSYRWFSKQAGFRSPNFLKLIVSGARQLSSASIEKVADVFQFSQRQREYFRNLVFFNRAKTISEREFFAQALLKLRHGKDTHVLTQSQYDYYSNWYNIPVREFLLLRQSDRSAARIAATLRHHVGAQEIEKAFALLEQLGMITRDKDGRFVPTDSSVKIGDQIASSSVAKFHRQMIQFGIDALDQLSAKERDVTAVTVGLSPAKMERAREMIRQLRQELLRLSEEDQDRSEIYQVNFQLFPLTKCGGSK